MSGPRPRYIPRLGETYKQSKPCDAGRMKSIDTDNVLLLRIVNGACPIVVEQRMVVA